MSTYDPGKYRAEIVDQGFEVSSRGTPCFAIQIRIRGRHGADARLVCPAYERTIRQYVNTAVGVDILHATLRGLDADTDDLTRLALDAADPIRLVGRTIDVECEHEEYAGRICERWRVARSTPKRLNAAAIRALTALQASAAADPAAADAPTPSAEPDTN